MTEKKITAEDMEKHLANRYYDAREWVFLTQVHSSTGGASRIADAMAFNMYRSTGYEVLGFEIKVSRSDWLSEMKQMSKSNEIMEYCDKWFLVVSDASIVKDGELPKHWGLLVLKDDKLVLKVRPTPQKPKEMPMHFIASILRRGADEVSKIRSRHVHRDEIQDEIRKAEERGYERGRGYNGKQTEENLKKLRENIIAFEESTGMKIEEWRGKEYMESLGRYVKVAMSLNNNGLRYEINHIESIIRSLGQSVIEMKQIEKIIENQHEKSDSQTPHERE